jgi:hypothetical protein
LRSTNRVSHGEHQTHSQKGRPRSARRHVRDECGQAEAADDERDHAENERERRQRTGAAVDDQHPPAVVCDQQSARIGDDLGLARRAHGRQSAIAAIRSERHS